jgi:Zn-finger nucleic acid-binding protein
MWLNEADAHRLQYNFSQAGHQLADSIGNEAPHVVCTRATDIPCPVCRKPMQRAKAGNTWVELDWCNGHGSWFDRGELQRIAHAYHGCLPSTSHETSSDTATDTAMAVGAELAIGIVFGLLEAALDS